MGIKQNDKEMKGERTMSRIQKVAEKKKRCVNCVNWEINNQFHSSYDGKVRAWCPILGNSIEGWELGCSNHKFEGEK